MNDRNVVATLGVEGSDALQLLEAFEEAENVLMKKYQYDFSKHCVVPPSKELMAFEITKQARLFHLESIAYDKSEDSLTKLSNLYNALAAVQGSVILIIDSNCHGVDFYLGTKTMAESDISIAQKTLAKALQGNFPGCVVKNQTNSNVKRIIGNMFKFKDESSCEEHRVVSVVNGIPNIREANIFSSNKTFAQGIEKLIDAMRGEIYSFMLIADPVDQRQISDIRRGYEMLYTKLVPFASADLSVGHSKGRTLSDSITTGVAETLNVGMTKTHGHTKTKSDSSTSTRWIAGQLWKVVRGGEVGRSHTDSDAKTEGESETFGTSETNSRNIGISNALTTGENQSLLIRTEDKSVKNLLARIDEQLKRLDVCGDLGMWNCAAYFISDDMQTSKTAASTYQALIRGENSSLEAIAINTWSYDEHDDAAMMNYTNFVEYLKKLHHPRIDALASIPFVTPTTLISSSELTLQAGLPQKSVSGLAVAQYAAFGREVLTRAGKSLSAINLGKIHHMGRDESIDVKIDVQSLAAHTFITGSTGAGKSNVIYKIIDELGAMDIPFLIVEAAKGEYKHVFGNRTGVHVFGTNPAKTPLLRINPFKFPADIHVLEHIDRMIEIFNVCWPMYAAMPAVLKDAVERSYQAAGWNLDRSANCYGAELFPNFNDLLAQLHNVLNESDFSQELKSNYIGALVTRVKSLTNGINGQVFVSNEIDSAVLFDGNTIVDLSRVASAETKAMIMGILIMRLQEYRMAEGGINRPLRHITVIEEAHHLLKRTSMEQSAEGANILGKSVEMLANSIAEMRTYGEGFIIADQSPNMLDMSAIRNTNTKIILRLPDITDRELVGRAASLDDDQIAELSRLPTGVAAVFQNNWLEPVLCHIARHESPQGPYAYKGGLPICRSSKLKRTLVQCLLGPIVGEEVDYNVDDLSDRVFESNYSTQTKLSLIHALRNKANASIQNVADPVSRLFSTSGLFESSRHAKSIEEWNDLLIKGAGLDALKLDQRYVNTILQCLVREKSSSDLALKEMYAKWTESMRGDLL